MRTMPRVSRSVVQTLAVGLALGVSMHARAQTYGYELYEIDESKWAIFSPTAMSSDGRVITGTTYFLDPFMTQPEPFLWALDSNTIDKIGLPAECEGDQLFINAINGNGTVFGGSYIDFEGVERAVRFESNNTYVDLPGFPNAPNSNRAVYSMSDDGNVMAGFASTLSDAVRPAIFTKASTKNAGTLPGFTGHHEFQRVSGDGNVFAGIAVAKTLSDRVIMRKVGNGPLENLGAPSGVPDWLCNVYDITSDGARLLIQSGHVWTQGVGFQPLPPPVNGYETGYPLRITADGQRVLGLGVTLDPPKGTAMIWDDLTTPFELRQRLLDHGVTLPEGEMLETIIDMSGDGTRILGWSSLGPNFYWVVTLPPLDVQACYADCDQSGDLSIDDFICYQTLFALGDPAADCDADTLLSIDDFICFQTLFAIGC